MQTQTHTIPGGVIIHQGHALESLKLLPDESINCCVTSPPYFGLRDYGHENQIGLEETPEAYVASLVAVFAEVRRVLRNDGTLFLNLGDSYANDGKWGGHSGGKHAKALHASPIGRNKRYTGLKPKDLIGIPWMVAFALRSDGWYLRSDIIWNKPNPMPESVLDRPTKAHEYIFLLSKSQKYFYDADAIAEPSGGWNGSTFDTPRKLAVYPEIGRKPRSGNKARVYGNARGRPGSHLGASIPWEGGKVRPQRTRAEQLAKEGNLTPAHIEAIRAVGLCDAGQAQILQSGNGKNTPEVIRLAEEAKAVLGGYTREFLMSETRNARSVWTIAPQKCNEAHFAVFPDELPRRCILAGCPEGGVVVDVFAGSGTTSKVARELNRRAILLELNPEYIEIMKRRLNADQGVLDMAA